MRHTRCLPLFLLILLAWPAQLFAQSKEMETALVNTERSLWEAWKNKDSATFEKTLDPSAVTMGSTGLMDRTASIKDIAGSNCQVRSYTLTDTKLTQIDKDTALLTYKANQDATCDGKKAPSLVNVSTIYEKHGDKWQPIFHQESPVPDTTGSSSQ
jgi:hypothetical protein